MKTIVKDNALVCMRMEKGVKGCYRSRYFVYALGDLYLQTSIYKTADSTYSFLTEQYQRKGYNVSELKK